MEEAAKAGGRRTVEDGRGPPWASEFRRRIVSNATLWIFQVSRRRKIDSIDGDPVVTGRPRKPVSLR
ncbi:hypothetical protein RSSM_04284 [Rhodopirellula sallentina SM41]|uniref:Uncharacterized protein n=1 Tax=Rhodopirellula sallentina SM41 TaxID=1263870 RepID=M5UE70_9BACT|nr:hypothetical protein RSSM_04284 [Rhodopirellula sallentina SM41]